MPSVKRDSMGMILCVAALISCIAVNGGIEWYGCIVPLFLLIAAAVINRASANGCLALSVVMLVLSIIPVCFTSADRQNAVHEIIKLALIPAAYLAGNSLKDEKQLNGIIFAAGVFAAAAGFILSLGIIAGEEWVLNDRGIPRLQSLYKYANTFAIATGAAYFTALKLYIEKRNKLTLVFTALLCAALYSSFSKAGIVLYVTAAAVYAVIERRARRVIITENAVFAAAAVIFFIIFSREYTSGETLVKRFVYVYDAFKLLKDHFILGIAPGAWRYYQYSIQSADYSVAFIHCGFLQLWLENGIAPFMIFVALSVLTCIRLIRQKRYEIFIAFALMYAHFAVDMDMSFGSTLIIIGFIWGFALKTSYKRTRRNSCIKYAALTVIGAVALYSASEYIIRVQFEYACANNSSDALVYGSRLKKITFGDSRLYMSLAVLNNDNKYVEKAIELSPLDPEIASLKLQRDIQNGNGTDIANKCREYILLAPKSEEVYFNAREYAKTAYEKGLCDEDEYREFEEFETAKRRENGVINRNELLEEMMRQNDD